MFTSNNLATDESEGGRKIQEISNNGKEVSRNNGKIPVDPNEDPGSRREEETNDIAEKKKPTSLAQLEQKERVLVPT